MNEIKQHFEQHAKVYLGVDEQLERIWQKRRPIFERHLDAGRDLQILDIGGGSGVLADRLLELFPKAHVTIVDLSQSLLDFNRSHPNKTLVCQDAWDFLREQRGRVQYDLINFDVLLHHILTPASFTETRNLQSEIIRQATACLAPGGWISIREIAYESMSCLPNRSTHRLLWFASTRRLPALLRRSLQRLGMNSQGGGVAFFSAKEIQGVLEQNGLEVVEFVRHPMVKLNWKYYAALAGDVTDLYVLARRHS